MGPADSPYAGALARRRGRVCRAARECGGGARPCLCRRSTPFTGSPAHGLHRRLPFVLYHTQCVEAMVVLTGSLQQ